MLLLGGSRIIDRFMGEPGMICKLEILQANSTQGGDTSRSPRVLTGRPAPSPLRRPQMLGDQERAQLLVLAHSGIDWITNHQYVNSLGSQLT